MKFVVLETGIFPDRETLAQALAALPSAHGIHRMEMPAPSDEAGWDRLLQALLAADRIIAL